MHPKFVPAVDLDVSMVYPGGPINGLRNTHMDWSGLYNDPNVGDPLANAMRHWNGECEVDVPFFIIGGGQSIADVLDTGRNIRLTTHWVGGVVCFVMREKRTFGKNHTSVLVIPTYFNKKQGGIPVEDLGSLRMKVNMSRGPMNTPAPDVSLSSVRGDLNFFRHVHNYVDSF